MTDAQTEARAIVSAALPPHEQAMLGGDAIVVLADLIATALTAKDAELATLREADGNFWVAVARAERAEAQLAEAKEELNVLRANQIAHVEVRARLTDQLAETRKALDALGAFAFWFQKYPEFKPNPDMQAEMLADLDRARPFIPASRALEAQGGENG